VDTGSVRHDSDWRSAVVSAEGRRRGSGPSWAEQLGEKWIGPLGPGGRWADFGKR
jgi:hypothetical protein